MGRKSRKDKQKYFKILLKTSDVDSAVWHELTDPLIACYQSSKDPEKASVLEIREFSGHSYRDYSDYLLEFIHAAHDGEIDLAVNDPLSFDEWKETHEPLYFDPQRAAPSESVLLGF